MRKRMIAALLCLAFALPAWGWTWGAMTDSAFRALCGKGSAKEVADVIKKDANVNAADEDGETPLMVAVKKGNAPVVDVLLAAGAKVNAKNARGEDALTLAVRAREPNAAIVASLLKNGADANAADKNGTTLLMRAVQNNAPAVAEALLANGADVQATDKNGRTAFDIAVQRSTGSIVPLVKGGADVNVADASGATPLFRAARDNYRPEMIKALIDARADVNAADQNGDSVLKVALKGNDHPEVIDMLLRAGADANRLDGFGHTTAFVVFTRKKPYEYLKKLVDARLDVNLAGPDGDTLLVKAVQYSDRECKEVVRMLLNAGADPNAVFRKMGGGKRTVLMEAVTTQTWTPQKNIDPAVIGILTAAGADPNRADENGTTALMIAAKMYPPRPDLLEALVNGGADVNGFDSLGHTALHRLALTGGNGSDESARKLIQLGAKVNLRDRNDKTPLMLARKYNTRLVKTLIDAGAE